MTASDPHPDLDQQAVDDVFTESSAKPARSVRALLGLLVAGLAAPILLFAAFTLWQVAAGERSRLEGEASDIARAVAVAIDRELTGLFASIDVVSNSAYLQAGNLEAFYRQSEDLARRQGIVPVLSDLAGQQLVNLRVPWGTTLPRTNLPTQTEAVGSARPFVTDLFTGQVSGEKQFAVATGVKVGGELRYVLNFSLPLGRLQAILAEADVPPAFTVSIVDRAGFIMARSSRPDEFVGREATADLRSNTAGQRGTWAGTTIDGTEVFGAYERSRLSGFRAAVGIRYSDLDAPLFRYLALFAGLGIATAVLAALLTLSFARRILEPMRALAGSAAALGRGEPVAPLSTGLQEANQVGAELAHASSVLLERETDLREANAEIQRFAYIVSHDLRSPLVNIMGFTTELESLRTDVFARLAEIKAAAALAETERDDELGRDFDEAIGFIKAAIGKMDRLINAILRLSREGRRDFVPERIDMGALLATIVASTAHQAEAAGATVRVGPLPNVVNDRLALEQVFSNLIDNALKYGRRDVAGRVEVTGRTERGNVIYEVRDNGRGIEERDRDRVFDLFRRSGVQDRPGEGIGLAHVRALVRRLGGNIALTSTLGQGSTFAVSLPRRWAGERSRKAQ